jgi:hypothetical protein
METSSVFSIQLILCSEDFNRAEEFGLAPVDEMVYSAVDDNDDVDRHEEKASDVD